MRLAVLLLSALLVTGCSVFGKKDGSEPMELVDFDSSAKVNVEWRKRVGKGQGPSYTRLVPAIDGDHLYVADTRGLLVAYERDTGKRLWRRKTGDAISGGVSSRNGVILYGTYAGELVAVDNADGSERWRSRVSGEIASVPRSSDALAVAQTMNGRVYAMNIRTGEQLWTYDNPPPVLTLRGTASPVVSDSAVFVGFDTGKVVAFNPRNGLILWEQRVALPQGRSELDRMIDVDASPIVRDGVLYAASYQGRIAAYNRASGRPIWAEEASIHEEMALVDNVLFATQDDGTVTAYNATSGVPLWENDQMLRRRLTGPQAVGQYLAVADFKGYIHIMNQADGEFVARYRIDRKGVRAPMISDGETLYVYSNRGRLRALTVEAR